MRGRAGGIAAHRSRRAFTFTQRSNDTAKVRGSFQETAARKTAQHTVNHSSGGVGSVVASHRGGGESSVVVTTLMCISYQGGLTSCKVNSEVSYNIPLKSAAVVILTFCKVV